MRTSPTTPLVSTIVAAALLVAAPLFSSTAHANLVTNGGFEDGLSVILSGSGGVLAGGGSTDTIEGDLNTWQKGTSTLAGSSSVIATNSDAYFDVAGAGIFAGPKAGSVAAVLPSGNGIGTYDGYITQAVSGVVSGQYYNISFYLSNQVGDPGNLENSITVNWGGSYTNSFNAITGGVDLHGPTALVVPTGWTKYTFNNVLAGSADSRLSFIGGSDNGAILIDEVVVEVVPEISSFGVLMGFGLLALGSVARIRRRSLAVA